MAFRPARCSTFARLVSRTARNASPDSVTFFSVAHRGPRSSSVLKNPWPDTHSEGERRDTRPSNNGHVTLSRRCRTDGQRARTPASPSFSTTWSTRSPTPPGCGAPDPGPVTRRDAASNGSRSVRYGTTPIGAHVDGATFTGPAAVQTAYQLRLTRTITICLCRPSISAVDPQHRRHAMVVKSIVTQSHKCDWRGRLCASL
jgi:hypothetical protein